MTLGGTGQELRDWLHVEDAAALLLAAAQAAGPQCPVFNGGTGIGTPITQIGRALADAWDRPELPLAFTGQSRAGDPVTLVADVSQARAQLGWQARIGWADGVQDYVRWFRAAQAGSAA